MNSRHLTLTAALLLACGQAALVSAQELATSSSSGASASAVDVTPTQRALSALQRSLDLARSPDGRNGPGNILIVPSSQTPPQALATLPEDMTVMSRILDQRLSQGDLRPAGFGAADYVNAFVTGKHTAPVEAIFLQDYGLLFFAKVQFPLSPPPKTDEQADKEKQPTDPVWAAEVNRLRNPELVAYKAEEGPAPKYDPEAVERVRETVLRTLRHAANIRALTPTDRLAVTLVYAPTGGTALYKYYRTGLRSTGRNITRTVDVDRSPTLLTIRVTKSDVDDFAAGKLDLAQFTNRAEISTLAPEAGQPRPLPVVR